MQVEGALGGDIQAIRRDADVISARQSGRQIAERMGYSRPDQALIATAISELARNIVNYAGKGEIEITPVRRRGRMGLRIIARDHGPGIEDLERAMADGFSTGNSFGLGLPGAKRIMDDFDVVTAVGEGVVVTAIKWMGR
ncbi:anti-sigma regulatory factor [Epibacterium sp. Ofav1-8]|uniref:anti-sigma regulatory factor n=1 Tax=Epibacterium sp. Ofav1-8 TaxID=2917735 RepID=UPI001EF6AA41|nr:anti-sigma regulatory factor [Epibacterium sp. Ofav1-8]MCG7622282.1 anti-sigma regulatory factor [Epibacterium sp. Ofav1-8]